MALNKPALKASIKQAFTDIEENTTKNTDPATVRDQLAGAIADAVDVFIKSGTVNTQVTTAGTAAAQTGTGVGTIT